MSESTESFEERVKKILGNEQGSSQNEPSKELEAQLLRANQRIAELEAQVKVFLANAGSGDNGDDEDDSDDPIAAARAAARAEYEKLKQQEEMERLEREKNAAVNRLAQELESFDARYGKLVKAGVISIDDNLRKQYAAILAVNPNTDVTFEDFASKMNEEVGKARKLVGTIKDKDKSLSIPDGTGNTSEDSNKGIRDELNNLRKSKHVSVSNIAETLLKNAKGGINND